MPRSASSLPPVWHVGQSLHSLSASTMCWEARAVLFTQSRRPHRQRFSGGRPQPGHVVWLQAGRQREWRESRGVEDFVGIGVADAAQEPRICECPCEGVVLACEGFGERVQRAVGHLKTTP